jgi:hypothetical protein
VVGRKVTVVFHCHYHSTYSYWSHVFSAVDVCLLYLHMVIFYKRSMWTFSYISYANHKSGLWRPVDDGLVNKFLKYQADEFLMWWTRYSWTLHRKRINRLLVKFDVTVLRKNNLYWICWYLWSVCFIKLHVHNLILPLGEYINWQSFLIAFWQIPGKRVKVPWRARLQFWKSLVY